MMQSDTILLTSSHYSIRDSLFTLDNDIYKKDENGNKTKEIYIDETRPISLFAIAAAHNLKQLFVVDNSPSGFWEGYKTSKEFKIPCFFGLKMVVCDNMNAKDDENTSSSRDTESNVIIFLKNSQSYYDCNKLYTKAAVDGFYYQPRLDWKTLNELWTPNLMLAIPFYSSFLAKNLLYLRRSIVPDIGKLNPTFFTENHDLPFDSLLTDTVKNYTQSNSYPIQAAHSIYYYKEEDHIAYQTLKCIDNRATLAKPNLSHHGSKKFSFQSYQELLKI